MTTTTTLDFTRKLTGTRAKKVPQLYEEDTSKYAGPHRWQIQGWAKLEMSFYEVIDS